MRWTRTPDSACNALFPPMTIRRSARARVGRCQSEQIARLPLRIIPRTSARIYHGRHGGASPHCGNDWRAWARWSSRRRACHAPAHIWWLRLGSILLDASVSGARTNKKPGRVASRPSEVCPRTRENAPLATKLGYAFTRAPGRIGSTPTGVGAARHAARLGLQEESRIGVGL